MTLRTLILCLAAIVASDATYAQTPSKGSERAAVSSSLSSDVLRDLPASASVLSILETTQPEAVLDRFFTGGLSTGQPARIGAFLTSPAQTLFRMGDANISDPDGSGTPLLVPDLFLLERVTAASALMSPDVGAPGYGVTLTPRRAGAHWQHIVEAAGAPQSWVSTHPSQPPPVARLENWSHVSAVTSGPLRDNLGVTAAGSWARGSQFQRGRVNPYVGTSGSAFGHLVWTRSQEHELQTLGWLQRTEYPFADRLPDTQARDISVHVQSSWHHAPQSGARWRAFGAFTQRARALSLDAPAAGLILERLLDGPVPDAAATGDTTSRRMQAGARLSPTAPEFAGRPHAIEIGVDLERTSSTTDPDVIPTIGELVDGRPARIWRFDPSGEQSHRRATVVSAFISDDVDLGARAHFTAALRYEGTRASADGSVDEISWHSILPRTSVRWQVTDRMKVAVLGGYARSAYALPLGFLAFGDPAAPGADVYRWDAPPGPSPSLAAVGPLVAVAGPGTRGNPAFSAIDPDLTRPLSDEIVIGVESRPVSQVHLGLTGIVKWERGVIGAVNTGVGLSDYAVLSVADPGSDRDPGTIVVPAYNRLPASFGRDRYLLTELPVQDPRVFALAFTIRVDTRRAYLQFGGTAQRAFTPAANRGFHPTENDQGSLGELFTNPNALTNGDRVRSFIDRGYTAKATFVYRFPGDVRLGAVARYTDGQSFAGMIVVPGLNQGTEAVRSFADGGTRFTYTATLDVRLQKGVRFGPGTLDAFVDVYNLTNHHHETEERTVLGPGFRTVTVIQPPRSVHVGARLTF